MNQHKIDAHGGGGDSDAPGSGKKQRAKAAKKHALPELAWLDLKG
jgi:hypothetical protein